MMRCKKCHQLCSNGTLMVAGLPKFLRVVVTAALLRSPAVTGAREALNARLANVPASPGSASGAPAPNPSYFC